MTGDYFKRYIRPDVCRIVVPVTVDLPIRSHDGVAVLFAPSPDRVVLFSEFAVTTVVRGADDSGRRAWRSR